MHRLNNLRWGRWLGFCLILLFAAFPARADEQAAWAALEQGGHVALMRHAVTVPGVGDPPGFRLDDCATQRLLSDAGRDWARRLGADLRKRGAAAGRVLTSAWCRCVETAELMDLGPVEVFEPLNSFFGTGDDGARQTEAARELMAAWRGPGMLVLVTHQVNVTALTGIYPASGEIVVLRPGGEVVGRIRP
ncbi:histidine phosphatase family protein [Skermanella mucosa]|uniref:histidine phosphatase family protein n=1 Tax=Skermanella mucosa TaxID=1789672 RepID=UPI001E555A46|nr:histidine phosphatase family protein [Skermanella mucosa]UEM22553.1 histidine phosphatase family protein [Skermanella mucosa]